MSPSTLARQPLFTLPPLGILPSNGPGSAESSQIPLCGPQAVPPPPTRAESSRRGGSSFESRVEAVSIISSSPSPHDITRSPHSPRPPRTRADRRHFYRTPLAAIERICNVPTQVAPVEPPTNSKRSTSAAQHLQEARKMSFLFPPINYLQPKTRVVFDNGGIVDMIGGANTSTSYSLSGHLVVELPRLPESESGRTRSIESLELTVEGMSDVFNDTYGYHSMRVYREEFRIVESSRALPIPSSSLAGMVQVAIPFDIRLPGWVPSSERSSIGSTAYGLTYKLGVGWMAERPPVFHIMPRQPSSCPMERSRPLSLATFAPQSTLMSRSLARSRAPCPAPTSTEKLKNSSLRLNAKELIPSLYIPFLIRRHRLISNIHGEPAEQPEKHYSVRSGSDARSPLETIVTVPEWVDLNNPEAAFRVIIRIRSRQPEAVPTIAPPLQTGVPPAGAEAAPFSTIQASDLPESTDADAPAAATTLDVHDSVTVLSIALSVTETERFSSHVLDTYSVYYPVPLEQPYDSVFGRAVPLISPRSPLADLSALTLSRPDQYFSETFTRACLVGDDGHPRSHNFTQEGLSVANDWRRLRCSLPIPHSKLGGDPFKNRPRDTRIGPLGQIKHSLKIELVCQRKGKKETTQVVLNAPIRFGTCSATCPPLSADCDNVSKLPPYVQLFKENCEPRDCDPLPLYTPQKYHTTPTAPGHEIVEPFAHQGRINGASATSPPSFTSPASAFPTPTPVDDSPICDASLSTLSASPVGGITTPPKSRSEPSWPRPARRTAL